MVVQLLSKRTPRLIRRSQLQPGTPTAPGSDDLPLLPSDPGGVYRLPPRRTQPSSPLTPDSPETYAPRKVFNPAVADCRSAIRRWSQGTASSPSSTTEDSVVNNVENVKVTCDVWRVTELTLPRHVSRVTRHFWERRGRDLNPRGSSPTRFPSVRTRPNYATSPSSWIVR